MVQAFLYNDILNVFITTGIIIGYLILLTILSKFSTMIYSTNISLSQEESNNTTNWFYYLSLGFTPVISLLVLLILKLREINIHKYSSTIIKVISICIFTFICIKIYIWDIWGFYFVINEINTPFNSILISFFKSISKVIPQFNFMYFNIIDPFKY